MRFVARPTGRSRKVVRGAEGVSPDPAAVEEGGGIEEGEVVHVREDDGFEDL